MATSPALDQALRLTLMPSTARALKAKPLPGDVTFLLRVLARDRDAELLAIDLSGRPIAIIREVAEYYAAEILFYPEASAYRVLAAHPNSSRDALRINMGLLLRWLHPDHNQTGDHLAYFERVVQAWELLKSPERRAEYDRRMFIAAPARLQSSVPSSAYRAPFFSTSPKHSDQQTRRKKQFYSMLLYIILIEIIISLFTYIYFMT